MSIEPFQGEGLENSDYEKILANLTGSSSEVKNSQSLFQTADMSKLIRTYLEEDIPEDYKKKQIFKEFWGVLGNTIKLTFLDVTDLADFEILFDQARINYIMSKPPYDFTFEDQQILDQFRIYFVAAIKRAVGFTGHRFNERIIQGGSINQIIRSNTESFSGGGGSSGKGFLSRLKSIF